MALIYYLLCERVFWHKMKKGPYNALTQYTEKNVLNKSFAHLKAVNIF